MSRTIVRFIVYESLYFLVASWLHNFTNQLQSKQIKGGTFSACNNAESIVEVGRLHITWKQARFRHTTILFQMAYHTTLFLSMSYHTAATASLPIPGTCTCSMHAAAGCANRLTATFKT